MKKLIKLDFNNTTRERKTEDSYSELYSHDKNNGSFEFEILNDTLTTEQVIALFKFTESNKIWKTTGTVEGNKVNVTFDTTLITQNETVICYLYFDEEQRTSDTFRFKFKVKVSEIDKMSRYEVKERFINNTVIVDRLDVVTKEELKEALKNVGGIATEGLLTEVKAEETYAKKSEAVDNTNFELVKNRVLALELKTDKDTVYDDSELKGRISVLEAREDNNTIYDDTNVRERLTALESKPNVDVNNLVTKDELASKNYLTEHQDTSNFALKSEIPQQYNDTEVKERLTTLENKQPVDLSNYATKEELRNVSGSQPAVDNLVTKEELEAKHYISDVSNLATKEELNEVRNSQPTVDTSHLVTREELESKGYLTELYLNNSTLAQRVSLIEEQPDKDTVYDDTPLKERVTALESKAIAGGAYDDSDLRNRVVALETKEDKDTKYDDTEVKNRLTELENKPAVDTSVFVTEDKLNSKGYLTQQNLDNYALKSELPNVDLSNYVTSEQLENKHYLTQHQELSHLATTSDLEALRNIAVSKAELSKKLDTTEYNSFKDSVVTKTELAEKGYLTTHQDISNLATKQEVEDTYAKKTDLPIPYNDSALVQKIGQLEARVDKDTVYDDTPLKQRVEALETKVDKDTIYNDEEVKQRLTALESRPSSQSEMRGTGMPNGVVEAPIGTTYIDTAKTNGALKWIKTTDGGTTGWKVVEGDTGWVLGWQKDKGDNKNRMYFRRKNDVVHVKFEPKIHDYAITPEVNLILDMGVNDIAYNLSIQGFQPIDDILQTFFKKTIDVYDELYNSENSEASRGTGVVVLRYSYNDNSKIGLELLIATSQLGTDENHVNPFSYLTEDEWPVQLPIIGG